MQNHYDGPPEDFAMVVPVPVVLKEEHVKTLPHDIFKRVDQMASPRLVEYWEQDPCNPYKYDEAEDFQARSVLAKFDDGDRSPKEEIGAPRSKSKRNLRSENTRS